MVRTIPPRARLARRLVAGRSARGAPCRSHPRLTDFDHPSQRVEIPHFGGHRASCRDIGDSSTGMNSTTWTTIRRRPTTSRLIIPNSSKRCGAPILNGGTPSRRARHAKAWSGSPSVGPRALSQRSLATTGTIPRSPGTKSCSSATRGTSKVGRRATSNARATIASCCGPVRFLAIGRFPRGRRPREWSVARPGRRST